MREAVLRVRARLYGLAVRVHYLWYFGRLPDIGGAEDFPCDDGYPCEVRGGDRFCVCIQTEMPDRLYAQEYPADPFGEQNGRRAMQEYTGRTADPGSEED